MTKAVLGIISLIILSSCTSNERSQYYPIGNEGWRYADTCVFVVPVIDDSITDGAVTGDVAIAVRHTNTYKYANIWVELTYSTHGEEKIDTFNIRLADSYGNWLGKGVGVSYQMVDTVLHYMPIDTVQPLLLRHIMRADTLQGIMQTGIVFYPKQ